MFTTMQITSPNSKEVEFLQSKDKSDEYMSHIRSLTIRENAVVFDVGANIGAFSISIANHIGPLVRIYSFEPFQEPFEHLVRNVSGLPVETINKAVMKVI